MSIHEFKTKRLFALGFSVWLAAGLGLIVPLSALADSEAGNLQYIIVSDDLRKETTEVARPGGTDDSAPPAAAGDDGKGNHGHGNNADGVDSSNPGQGQGGPNGGEDPSGGVDDEAGGGGASPSKKAGKGSKK